MQKRSEREILILSSTKEENTDQKVIHTLFLEYLTVDIRHRTHSISSYERQIAAKFVVKKVSD